MKDHTCAGRTCLFCRATEKRGKGRITGEVDKVAWRTTQELTTASHLRNLSENIQKTDVDDLENVVFFDTATGLYNSRTILRELDVEMKRAFRYKNHVSVCMVSISSDTPETLAQGSMMRDGANLLKKSVRETDVAGRFNKNELAVILPDTDSKGAAIAAERIKQILQADLLRYGASISLAIASYQSQNSEDKQKDLVGIARQALNNAISTGVTEVVIAN